MVSFLSRYGGNDIIVRRPLFLNLDLDSQLIPRVDFLEENSGGDEAAAVTVATNMQVAAFIKPLLLLLLLQPPSGDAAIPIYISFKPPPRLLEPIVVGQKKGKEKGCVAILENSGLTSSIHSSLI
ncbi:hypothetical protein OIU76_001060 [Salix suchowensis]|nr:hypothetical protein OIU76_001060 [Salix suchowensis]